MDKSKLPLIIAALFVFLAITAQPASSRALSISLSQDEGSYAVVKVAGEYKYYIYGKLDTKPPPLATAKGTSLLELPGNPCGEYAKTNIKLNILNTVATQHTTKDGAWVTSEESRIDVPGSCVDIGDCAFRCEYLNDAISKTIDKTIDHCVNEFCYPPAQSYSYAFYDSSRDPLAPAAFSPHIKKELSPSPDGDGDGVPDAIDDCDKDNFDQIDLDHNNIGDVCEDEDKDGVPNSVDNCMGVSNSKQENSDGDTLGDACPTGAWPTTPGQGQSGDNKAPIYSKIPGLIVKNPPSGNEHTEPSADAGAGAVTEEEGKTPVVSPSGAGTTSESSDTSTTATPPILKFYDEGSPCTLMPAAAPNPFGFVILLATLLPLVRRKK